MSVKTPPTALNPMLVTATHARSLASEQYRQLRTSIDFLGVDHAIQSVMMTSSVPGSGKSLTAANLALTMAQVGKRTLLIDADLRKPSIHLLFGDNNTTGLTAALTHLPQWSQNVHVGPIENLSILTSGPVPPNPSELLSSHAMRQLLEEAKNAYEMVILDTPPVVTFTDAVALSVVVDGTVLVVRAGLTSRKNDIKAKDRLTQVQARLLGFVFNDVKIDQGDAAYYYYGSTDRP